MILDTSAVLAILLDEPEAQTFVFHIGGANSVAISGPTLVEVGVVVGAKLGFQTSLVHRFLQEADIITVPFGDAYWQEAISAYARFGKGRHKAKLNLGDCFSYATAKLLQRPLLCKGNDFRQTDIALVV